MKVRVSDWCVNLANQVSLVNSGPSMQVRIAASSWVERSIDLDFTLRMIQRPKKIP